MKALLKWRLFDEVLLMNAATKTQS